MEIDTLWETFYDDLGPEKIIHIHDPRSGLKAIVVIDNVARGPAIGGVRLAPDITTEEVFRLARAMTLKNAAAGLRHGGAKSGIIGDPHLADKEPLIRAFARRIRTLTDYIPGPDMGTNEHCMAWVNDEIGRCVGLPRSLGGVPLDEIGATGFGVAVAAELALPHAGLSLQGASVAVQGFGNVGRHAARFLEQKGARLVAASDSRGTAYKKGGLDVATLIDAKQRGGSVISLPGAEILPSENVVEIPCDLLIPAARPDVIHDDNVERVQARVIIEGANIPITESAEKRLHQRNILCIPDFIANAGGVICGAVEYRGGSEAEAFAVIREKIAENTREMLALMEIKGLPPRGAAQSMAEARVRNAMAFRR
ncbi:glutamate dehydrogenase [Desulfuromonas versatilis]|uniref:Glutamate dehydrogenase n=1 Tax=Desulfuromonas versatilis TaxID=2802975 RepID=A0ABM8HY09_9BACT|nr:Glu/Leu/Phe/Val dehydrogenase [Desulfuromonas versatilis]BCR05416.1 glutamate dehydrogenase [Desulfuromonas versatilis]